VNQVDPERSIDEVADSGRRAVAISQEKPSQTEEEQPDKRGAHARHCDECYRRRWASSDDQAQDRTGENVDRQAKESLRPRQATESLNLTSNEIEQPAKGEIHAVGEEQQHVGDE
jgi:hypothetical protein